LLKESLMKNASDVGAFMLDRLRELQQKHAIIGDVRGKGLMIGIELVRDRVTKERATTERDKIVDACFEKGLLVLGAGKNAIRISPPLVLTRSQAATAVEILDQAIASVAGKP
jgi:4-aminobutyrate aminotransferase